MKRRIRTTTNGQVTFTAMTPEEADRIIDDEPPHRVWEIDTDAGTCVEIPRQPKPKTPGETCSGAYHTENLRQMRDPGAVDPVPPCWTAAANAVLEAHWHERLTDAAVNRIMREVKNQTQSHIGLDYGAIRKAARGES